MQPLCDIHPSLPDHRHCPSCRELVIGNERVYTEHAWDCRGRR